MRFFPLLLLSLALYAGCSNTATRQPQSTSVHVPTSRELFLEGTFNVRRAAWRLRDENHFGEEMDLSKRRPVVELSGTVFETKYGLPGHKLYANFYHNDAFHIVRVPDRAVKNLYVQLSYFPPIVAGKYVAAHSLLRFEMLPEAPLHLVAPMPDLAQLEALRAAADGARLDLLPAARPRSEENLIRNAAISAEAQWTKNDRERAYNLIRGKNGAFIQIVRFVSIVERYKELYQGGNPVNQMLLEGAHGDQVLAEGLRTSESDALNKLYDTLWYNCTTTAFDIIERGGQGQDNRLGHIRSFMQRRVPVIAPYKLEQYGGITAFPMATDATLLQESLSAYRQVIATPGRVACPQGMSRANCQNIERAVGLLRENRLLP